ncbi:MAG: helix-turn-helix transcriptional regulator [Ramlibacter sp.]|nr:helix-turn-helix transcriptional regulator [Ramlibacter sp.]
MNLDERIQILMRENDWDVAAVARIAGVSSSAVSQWLGRGNKQTKAIANVDVAERLSRASGYTALWIAKGLGTRFRDEFAPTEFPPHDPYEDCSKREEASHRALDELQRLVQLAELDDAGIELVCGLIAPVLKNASTSKISRETIVKALTANEPPVVSRGEAYDPEEQQKADEEYEKRNK